MQKIYKVQLTMEEFLKSPYFLSSLGLILDIIGVIILFFFTRNTSSKWGNIEYKKAKSRTPIFTIWFYTSIVRNIMFLLIEKSEKR
ncbi:MAG: hypothetical protein CMH46_11960 [Muricauda sp.]|nr:hypothetical protein [Allomuricauda sp.]